MIVVWWLWGRVGGRLGVNIYLEARGGLRSLGVMYDRVYPDGLEASDDDGEERK